MADKYLSIKEAMDKGEGSVNLRGWVYRERGSNKFRFIVLRDSTNIIQCVISREAIGDAKFEIAKKIQIETSMTITGKIRKEERAPTGYELDVEDMDVVGECDTYPITKDQSQEFLLDKRHLWIRSRKMTAIMKIRATVTESIHEFFKMRGYYEFTAPVLQPNQCEGGATLFEVKYYTEMTYLSQTWQLYAESAIFALEKVYNIGPTFRAEKSKTSRHLSEFWMSEMEAAWMDYKECSEVAKEEVKFIIKKVLETNEEELKLLGRDIEKLRIQLEKPFPTITYTEAIEQLKKAGMDMEWGKDLRTLEEDKLMELYDTPIVVTHYPKEIMAFYKPVDPEVTDTPGPVAKCFDMLAPEGYGEIVGGSERETDIDTMKKALVAQGEDLKNYEFYFDLRKYGSVPHSGYGLGVERLLTWICGLENVKDSIPFPRTMLRWSP